jgi:hypothetical protein
MKSRSSIRTARPAAGGRRQVETIKDFDDGFWRENGRNDAHSTAATIAAENVRGKYELKL